MALSRTDLGKPERRSGETDEQLAMRWHLYSDDRRTQGPPRAFFNPGVGLWQFDDAGGPMAAWVPLNHGERADTGVGAQDDQGRNATVGDTGGEILARMLAGGYCGGATDEAMIDGARDTQASQWYACGKKAYDGWNRQGSARDAYTNNCYDTAFTEMYLPSSDDLYVTIAQDEGRYSTTGGAIRHSCRWSDDPTADPIKCFLYDTGHPEGWIDAYAADVTGTVSSPLAGPFVAFTDDAKRFAVFPDKVLDALSGIDDMVDSTRYKAVPQTEDARDVDGTWSTSAYSGAVLQMRVCEEAEWVKAAGSDRLCDWVSVSEARIARLVGLVSDEG